ncbi:MAG: ribonuclease J [bacterium]
MINKNNRYTRPVRNTKPAGSSSVFASLRSTQGIGRTPTPHGARPAISNNRNFSNTSMRSAGNNFNNRRPMSRPQNGGFGTIGKSLRPESNVPSYSSPRPAIRNVSALSSHAPATAHTTTPHTSTPHTPRSGGASRGPRGGGFKSFRPTGPRSTRGSKAYSADPNTPDKFSDALVNADMKREKADKEDIIPVLKPGNIRIIPLGGVEEVGKNMTAIEMGDDIIIIDAGIQFKTEDTPGVDYILPNTTYLEDNKHKIRGIAITHGHLDHVGAIPYIVERLGNPTIFTCQFGALLIKKRHSEFPHLPELDFKIMSTDDAFYPIGKDLKIKFFGITHSIPDSAGVIIETPYGDIVATGDVRVENELGVVAEEEFKQYAIFKDRKVLLLMMDSTGIEKPGWTISENAVTVAIDKYVKETNGRLIIATFSSQVERIIRFIDIAKKYGRIIVIEGRSMKNNVEIIKFLKLTDTKHIINADEMKDYPPHKLMVIATGAQGEEFGALMRMANNTNKNIKLTKNDTIILSSSVIPGNEKSVAGLKDNLFRHDIKIITYFDSDVHAGGHGKRGELEWIHRQIPYKFFMPVHGHHYMLKMHAQLSVTIGTDQKNVVVPDNGSVVEIQDGGEKIVKLKERAPHGLVLVDGFSIGDVQEVVIRDRQMLAQDGMFVIIANVNPATGKLRKSPDIISRGFVYLRESQELLHQTRLIVKKTIEEAAVGMNPIDFDYVKNNLSDNVSKFLMQQTAKRPMVIPVIIGI